MFNTFIGIDPGKNGAICAIKLDAEGKPKVRIYPMTDDPVTLRTVLGYYERDGREYFTVCALEQVHASQRMGVSNAFTFGMGYGITIAVLSTLRITVKNVTPQKWQAALNCRTGGDKKISKKRAKELFPDLEGITQSNADAILLAYYAYKANDAK